MAGLRAGSSWRYVRIQYSNGREVREGHVFPLAYNEGGPGRPGRHILPVLANYSIYQFMQRAAASDLNRTPSTSSPLPASPRDLDRHTTKRQKISSSVPVPVPAFPSPHTSTPRACYQSDDPSTPVSPEGNQSSTRQSYGGNAAETPWVLHLSRRTDDGHAPSSPLEYTSPPDRATGRRRFGNFKTKSSEKKAETGDGEPDDGSLSSPDSDENYEQYSERMSGAAQQNSAKPPGKRRQDQDDHRSDKINLKKRRSGGGGISASSGMRQPGFNGRKYEKDRRRG